MRNILSIALAGLVIMSAASSAMAQTRGTASPQRPPSTYAPSNPYGLANCSERPFARDCDRRGTW